MHASSEVGALNLRLTAVASPYRSSAMRPLSVHRKYPTPVTRKLLPLIGSSSVLCMKVAHVQSVGSMNGGHGGNVWRTHMALEV